MNTENNHVAFLLGMIRPLVSNQDAVKVEESHDEMGVLLTLSLAQPDMGKVIGKMGQTATAIRTVLKAYGGAMKSRISLKINEPEGSTHIQHQSQN